MGKKWNMEKGWTSPLNFYNLFVINIKWQIYYIGFSFCLTFNFTFFRRCGLVGATPLRTPNYLNCYTRMALPSWVRLRYCKRPFSTVLIILFTCCYLIGDLWLLGPPSQAMWALGDKIASSVVAQTAGIPTLPWSGTGPWIPLSQSCPFYCGFERVGLFLQDWLLSGQRMTRRNESSMFLLSCMSRDVYRTWRLEWRYAVISPRRVFMIQTCQWQGNTTCLMCFKWFDLIDRQLSRWDTQWW